MNYELAYSFLLPKLEKELPTYITYHNVQHTKNVIAASEYLAIKENIEGDDLIILKTAALFHDAGFLENHVEHEALGCIIAKKHLPNFSYNEEQINAICALIMATKLPQTPLNQLAEIICDADLFYLGGDEYTLYADKLFEEYKKIGILNTMAEWQLKQVEFLTLHQFFTSTAKKEKTENKQKNISHLQEKIAISFKKHKSTNPLEIIQDFLLILFGVVFAGFALKGFLVPNHFFDGGLTGISLLIHELYHINLTFVIILLNLPLIIISYFSVGKRFALRTLLSVVLLGICLWILPEFVITTDKLIISIFGGVFLGIGIGLVMRAGAALDGIEVLALYTLKKTSFTITEIILGLNVLIFTIAAFKFGIETALYSVLTYFTATRCIDYVVEGIQAYTGVTIISAKSEIIKYQLVNNLGRGISIYKGERGFLPGSFEVSAECDIIFTVITRLEMRKLKNLVYEVDPKAFVFANTIKEASGGVIKRRNEH